MGHSAGRNEELAGSRTGRNFFDERDKKWTPQEEGVAGGRKQRDTAKMGGILQRLKKSRKEIVY